MTAHAIEISQSHLSRRTLPRSDSDSPLLPLLPLSHSRLSH